ncbi:VOC family protein [Sphingomonas jatrophae]|uniref:Glyoxalase/Bleomycin resistance protein/Dioxygenase superfamily protein n=1 Tax=Sphingomonas jatrophae TaxID=1166337 RepID=A0A1I6M144_9SPHN|nr:VOC family protein [Sphingomonas jatrophae]SFS09446.1 Glyoxalase/Bleomycin resistance protein/Dioxygenase superfamily protein [Sphingomonas jatrophae]
MSDPLAHFPVRQIAYFTNDVRAAAARHAALYGSGPFFVSEHIPLRRADYRGRPGTLDHSSAYGQWGALMVEFVQQNDAGASVFRDLYPSGGEGLHHIALIVDDLAAAAARFEAAGMPCALHAEMMDGFPFLMMDGVARYGHFVELYEGTATLTGFYDFVARAAEDYDGREPVRDLAA